MRRTGSVSSNSCPPIIPKLFAAEIIGYFVGYANLTNTRSLALLGDADASAYELLFSFSCPEQKNEFLNLVRSNADMGMTMSLNLRRPQLEKLGMLVTLGDVPLVDDLEAWRHQVREILRPRQEWRIIAEACDAIEAVTKNTAIQPRHLSS